MTRKLVNDFIAAGRPSSRKQNIEERRAGYVASTVLAGDMEMRVQVRSFEPEDICFWIASPLQSNGPLPAVIYYHGGCFVSGGVATHEKQLRQLAYYGNCHVIAVEYRLAPEHTFPAAHDDALKGADIVWRNASQFGVNSNQITLAGDSAGGHLALVTALLAACHPCTSLPPSTTRCAMRKTPYINGLPNKAFSQPLPVTQGQFTASFS